VNDKTDWIALEKFLSDNKEKGKVSISGGGDCLYKYSEHIDWWGKFFSITDKLDMLVDVHTREKFFVDSFWVERINRCVFSSDKISDDKDYLIYLSKLTKIRVTHLVTADTTLELIEEYLDFQRKTGCQFTVKQLIGYDDNGMYRIVRNTYPETYSLDAGDYNIYYMPDNRIYTSFLLERGLIWR